MNEGQVTCPIDKRTNPMKREQPHADDADAFFLFIYMNLAEPLALLHQQEEPAGSKEHMIPMGELPPNVSNTLSEWVVVNDPREDPAIMAAATLCPQQFAEKRWLPHSTLAQLFSLCPCIH